MTSVRKDLRLKAVLMGGCRTGARTANQESDQWNPGGYRPHGTRSSRAAPIAPSGKPQPKERKKPAPNGRAAPGSTARAIICSPRVIRERIIPMDRMNLGSKRKSLLDQPTNVTRPGVTRTSIDRAKTRA